MAPMASAALGVTKPAAGVMATNPATTISYAVPRITHGPGMVELKVYDLLGREVATLVHQPQGPGEYTVPFHATGLASGVYVYRLAIDGTTAARTMLLMK